MMRFFLLAILTISYILLIKIVVNEDVMIYDSISKMYNQNEAKYIYDFQKKWEWLTYILIVLMLFIKGTMISSILYIGAFFLSTTKVTFRQLFDAVINAEFIFLIVGIIKIIWFYFFQTTYNLEDIQYFYPLSALNFIDHKELEPWLIYPLQTLNVFELVYIIVLSYQLGTLTKTNADTGLKIVASSYIPALLLWVTIVMFFTLNFS